MPEKKRKRNDDAADRPSKKAAVLHAPVKVQHVANMDVVLAATPGLNYPRKITFTAYKAKHPAVEDAPELLFQSSEHPRLDYTAMAETDGSSESQLSDYVGVFDPATGRLQLLPVPKVTVRSTLRSEIDELRAEKERVAAAKGTMTARRHALATEFGSKRSKKAIVDMTENAITRGRAGDAPDETVSSAVLQGMSKTTSAMPTKDQIVAAVDSSKPRPKHNAAAEYPADVYPVDTIVGKDLMGLIPVKDWVEAAQTGTNVDVHSRFVAKRIFKLAKAKEIQKLKVLRFILLCVNFNAALRVKGRGAKLIPPKDKLLAEMGDDIPPPVVDSIRRRFASENNDMTRWNIDNLMTHICAAALIVDNFEVDVNDLRDDLKLENKEIKQYFHELGCRITVPTENERSKMKISKAEAINHNLAKLRLPLSFPKVKTIQNKKR